ncbi:rhomboid family intramembrane serine protease [Thermophagus sp. OGC60D27]|uniref:rhomboid family intramembrane serine protease n=1 Tax=Thermophagus sp. OGC60D27 TaxID=3458415 RepID=UPI0040378732
MNLGGSSFGGMTPAVKNLIIINAIFYVASLVFYSTFGLAIEDYLGLHLPSAEAFNPFQLVTYMFLHAYFSPAEGIIFFHLFFNMFALFMFGRMLEMVWGTKRFLIYYFVTGIGAAVVHIFTQYIEVMPMTNAITDYLNHASPEALKVFLNEHLQIRSYEMKQQYDQFAEAYNQVVNTNQGKAIALSKEYLFQYREAYLNSFVTVGASGAVFGILLAFGMLFPNTQLMLLFPPIPIRAKYFVIIYGLIELFMGVRNFSMDNVAHWAHLGGMLFGFILIKYWKNKGNFY